MRPQTGDPGIAEGDFDPFGRGPVQTGHAEDVAALALGLQHVRERPEGALARLVQADHLRGGETAGAAIAGFIPDLVLQAQAHAIAPGG